MSYDVIHGLRIQGKLESLRRLVKSSLDATLTEVEYDIRAGVVMQAFSFWGMSVLELTDGC
jgi:hypothetical protein